MEISKSYSCQGCEAVISHLNKLCVVIFILKIVKFNECAIVYVINFIRIRPTQNVCKLFLFYIVNYNKNNLLKGCDNYCDIHQCYNKLEYFYKRIYKNQLGNVVIVNVHSFS